MQPPPAVVAGRRLWTHDQVLQAAAALAQLTADLRQRIDGAFGIERLDSGAGAAPGGTK